MELVNLEALSPGTQAQYRRVWRWLLASYHGPWDRTEGLQQFLRDHPSRAVREGLRGRVAQALVNRHCAPRPAGPPVTLRLNHPRDPTRTHGGEPGTKAIGTWWHTFVPRYLWQGPAALLRDPGSRWAHWVIRYVRALGASVLKAGLIRAYVAYVVGVLHPLCPDGSPAAFAALTRDVLVAAVLAHHPERVQARRLCRVALNRFLGDVVFADASGHFDRLRMRSLHLRAFPASSTRLGEAYEEAVAVTLRQHGERDHFTQAEVDALLTAPTLGVRDRLILYILAETGLRRRAVSWLTVAGVWDATAACALDVCRTVEKGSVCRAFALSPHTRTLLGSYLRDQRRGGAAADTPDSGPWLFPSERYPGRPIAAAVINQVVQRACRSVNIHGRHCHAHAFRKHVVCRLMALGNRVEDVAKWIGHRTVNLTYATYWDCQMEELRSTMRIPWLPEQND